MNHWRHESQLSDFIVHTGAFSTSLSLPTPDYYLSQQRKKEIQRALEQVQKLQACLEQHGEATQIQYLVCFLKSCLTIGPKLSIEEQYMHLKPLRTWLFWMPVGYLQNSRIDTDSLLATAYLYAVALLMEPLFPEIGAAYYGTLCTKPIEEIFKRLISTSFSSTTKSKIQAPLTLMEFPIDILNKFRSRTVSPNLRRNP